MLALGLHMYHGFFSLLNTLGFSHARKPAVRRATALALAFVVVAGNISIPVAVMTGLVHL
jgi:succinate dehydrogenase / fumarate reductase cytochrome b subunit